MEIRDYTILALFCAAAISPGAAAEISEWPYYASDAGSTHYSSLAEINTSNVAKLRQVWAWKTGETEKKQYHVQPGAFEDTPLMMDGVLYVTTPYHRIVALDAESGSEIWSYDPKSYVDGPPPTGPGLIHRGVAAWRDARSGRLRLFLNTRYRLICVDAKTGKPVDSFGDNGIVDLSQGLAWPINKMELNQTSPPVIYKELVIVGSGVPDRIVRHNDPPGDVRAFDARTGKRVWTFHTIPQQGEFGTETWGGDSWKFTGHTNVWAPMTLDERRGLLYLPVSTPSNDFFGGNRPGSNLFADSLVCLDAATGRRKWHFQMVHHGLWDYDLPAAPVLATINVDGRRIDAVVQLTKQGFAFVFDRVTGKPVWPIEERPVPPSDVAGEHASATQPFPTKPPAFSPQGMTVEEAFNLTPDLKAEAQEQLKKFRIGPLFTPPSLKGTILRPASLGGANWGGGALDPESGILYIKTSNLPNVVRIRRSDRSAANPRASEVDSEWIGEMQDGNAVFHNGLPLTKPPYGQLTAIDLNHGTIRWQEAFGDWRALRSHPALQGAKLPKELGIAGPQGTIVTKGGLLFVGGGDTALHAIDKGSGQELWEGGLPGVATSTPMTYRTRSGKQEVVIATGQGEHAALVAFGLGLN
jgi:quinoprotein glucose dehydrogenase